MGPKSQSEINLSPLTSQIEGPRQSVSLTRESRSFLPLSKGNRSSPSLTRPVSTASLRRASSTASFSHKGHQRFWADRLSLLFFFLFIFWNFRTGHDLVNKIDPSIHQMKPFGVAESLHPQETYSHKNAMTLQKLEQLRGPEGPKYNVLVTGAAGFIGMFTALELKKMGMTPIGYDNVNSYYSTKLKELRIQELQKQGIEFVKGDVCDRATLKETIQKHKITRVVHLAAQAGVRYSLDHADEYTRNNVDCFVRLVETMVELGLEKEGALIYASSSSVYGNNAKIPFRESDRLEDPASLYAATKRSDELIAQSYFNLHQLESIGLRFFTVYGPYGRPDMAPWIFTAKISNNETIQVFNHGQSKRDFTYVGDIVQGVANSLFLHTGQPELINLGNGRPILLAEFVRMVELQVGSPAKMDVVGMQKGDVPVTYADISKAKRMLAYNPSTPIEEGIVEFVQWFRENDASRFRLTD